MEFISNLEDAPWRILFISQKEAYKISDNLVGETDVLIRKSYLFFKRGLFHILLYLEN